MIEELINSIQPQCRHFEFVAMSSAELCYIQVFWGDKFEETFKV
jgi:hypothetical protein